MNIHVILCHLVKFLNCVVYEHILIKRVTEEVERILTAINVNRVFTQFLMLILFCSIEAARTLLLNSAVIFFIFFLTLIIVTVFRVHVIMLSHIDIVKSVKRNEERERKYYKYFFYN